MDIHQHVAVLYNVGKQGMGNAVCQCAVRAAREMPVQVATIRQIAAALLKAGEVHDGHADNPATEFFWVQVVHAATDNFDAVELVTMNRAGQAQGRALVNAIDHQYRGNLGQPGNLNAWRPGQSCRSAG